MVELGYGRKSGRLVQNAVALGVEDLIGVRFVA
jgi:hypothetical protein